MDLLFALYDSDVFYVTRFMEYFRKKKEFNFIISIFTRKETLVEFLKSNIIEILLIHESLPTEDIPFERVRHVYKLSEALCNITDSDCHTVFKYQAVKSVMEEIVHHYHMKLNSEQMENRSKKVRLISIFPLRPELEDVTYTWAISSLLAKQRKVLLVILDPLPVPLIDDLYNKENNLSEFIYYLKGNTDINIKLKALTNGNYQLSYLSGIAHGSDILSISKEDIQKWVEELRNSVDYQTVIFYLGGYTEAGNELMRLSDIVSIPLKNSPYQKELYQVLCKQMLTAGIDIHSDRFIEVSLPNDQSFNEFPATLQDISGSKAWSTANQHINTYL